MSSDVQKFLNKIPPFTKYYLGSVLLTSFLLTYPMINNIFSYINLDYESAFLKFQVWRLVTNFVIVGKFSMSFLFFFFMMYQQLNGLEIKAIAVKKYSEFVMMMVYNLLILLLINFILQYKLYLSMELLFCLIYIGSKREPDLPVSLWGFKMKCKY